MEERTGRVCNGGYTGKKHAIFPETVACDVCGQQQRAPNGKEQLRYLPTGAHNSTSFAGQGADELGMLLLSGPVKEETLKASLIFKAALTEESRFWDAFDFSPKPTQWLQASQTTASLFHCNQVYRGEREGI